MLGLRYTDDVIFSAPRASCLWWPYRHADWLVGFPARFFLLVFYSHHSSKTHRFSGRSMGQTDRWTDGETDRQQLRLMFPLWWGERNK